MYPPFGGYGPYGTYGNLGLYGALVSYGTLSLTVSSPLQSFTEPFTVGEVQNWLKIDPSDLSDQNMIADIQGLISAARVQAEIEQNRDLIRKQYDLALDYWPGYRVELRAPLQSVDLVQYTDSDNEVHIMQQNVDYVVDTQKQPGTLTPPYQAVTWPVFMPWPTSAILVRFTSGFSQSDPWWQSMGAHVKIGMKQLITEWFYNRLPFDVGRNAVYPDRITMLLSFGAVPRAR